MQRTSNGHHAVPTIKAYRHPDTNTALMPHKHLLKSCHAGNSRWDVAGKLIEGHGERSSTRRNEQLSHKTAATAATTSTSATTSTIAKPKTRITSHCGQWQRRLHDQAGEAKGVLQPVTYCNAVRSPMLLGIDPRMRRLCMNKRILQPKQTPWTARCCDKKRGCRAASQCHSHGAVRGSIASRARHARPCVVARVTTGAVVLPACAVTPHAAIGVDVQVHEGSSLGWYGRRHSTHSDRPSGCPERGRGTGATYNG
jgi:hypothetical protein